VCIAGLNAAAIRETAARHGARNVRVFGSAARGDDRPGSDLDLLVDMDAGRTLLDLVALKQDLEDLLGRRVDVVTERSLSPHLRDAVLAAARTVDRFSGTAVVSAQDAFIQIQLPPELEQLVRNKLRSGRFDTAGEVVREALLLLEDLEGSPVVSAEETRRHIEAGWLAAQRRAGRWRRSF